MKIIQNCILLLSTACIFSCSEQTFSAKEILPKFQSDSIVRDIPTDIRGDQTLVYQRLQLALRYSGLDSLQNGFNDLLIRLWFMNMDSVRIVSIEGLGNKWHAEFLHWKSSDSQSQKNNQRKWSKKPKSGWNIFLGDLISYDVFTLPDQSKIPNYPAYADGDGVIIEIATANLYRFYYYHAPSSAQNQILQAKNVVNIAKLIEKEFGIKVLHESITNPNFKQQEVEIEAVKTDTPEISK